MVVPKLPKIKTYRKFPKLQCQEIWPLGPVHHCRLEPLIGHNHIVTKTLRGFTNFSLEWVRQSCSVPKLTLSIGPEIHLSPK